MIPAHSPLTPENWLRDLFDAQAVRDGAVIRRKARDIERYAGMDRFLAEVRRRGFQVAENSGQIVIFCNRAQGRWLTGPPAGLRALSLQESGT
jgi:hypothetical protein